MHRFFRKILLMLSLAVIFTIIAGFSYNREVRKKEEDLESKMQELSRREAVAAKHKARTTFLNERAKLKKLEQESVDAEITARLKKEAEEKAKKEDEAKAKKEKELQAKREKAKSAPQKNSAASRSKITRGRKYHIETLTVTAYAPFDNQSGMCNDGDPTKTSTGSYPAVGTVAVNPKRFPYGTEFYIEGYGKGVALDTGGAMRQNSSKIDVVLDSYSETRKWGVRTIDVIVFDD